MVRAHLIAALIPIGWESYAATVITGGAGDESPSMLDTRPQCITLCVYIVIYCERGSNKSRRFLEYTRLEKTIAG